MMALANIDPSLALAANRPEVTMLVRAGATRLLLNMGYAPLWELPLANNRRADICAIGRKGEIIIVEVKSGFEDFRNDGKWPEYGPFCDQFFFAVAPDFPISLLENAPCGLIIADQFGAGMVRPAPVTPLAAGRRKAMTLSMARLACARALPNDLMAPDCLVLEEDE